MHYPDLNNLLNFELTIEPDEVGEILCTLHTRVQGFYKRGRFHFTFTINDNYPHDPPKVSYWALSAVRTSTSTGEMHD
jgi:ubiquitin-conjugating enzyme E2 M